MLKEAWRAILSVFRPRAQADWSNPEVWSPAWGAVRMTTAGEKVSPDRAMALPVAYACLRNIPEDLAKLPFVLYERMDPRGRRRATDFYLYPKLHDEPNPDMGSFSFRETLTHWALGWGNGYAEIQRDNRGRVLYLWPIHPSRARIDRNKAGEIVYEVHSDDRMKAAGDPQVVVIPAADMFHLKGLGNGLSGYSVIQALAAETVGLGLAQQIMAASFFGNGTHVGGVIETVHKLDAEQITALRTSWREIHGGASKGHNVAILQQGYQFKPTAIPPDEAQFLESRQFQVEDVLRFFRMPPHKVQHLLRATFSNIEHQDLEYWGDTIQPWDARWKSEVHRKLLTPAERLRYFAEHEFKALMRTDSRTRAEFYRTRFGMGSMSPNDIREHENENPIDDPAADEYYVQKQLVPLSMAANPTPEPAPMGTGGEEEEEGEEESGEARFREAAEAHRPVFLDAGSRAARRETHGARQGVKMCEGKPDEFARWATRFYSGQRAYIVEAFGPPTVSLARVAEICGFSGYEVGHGADSALDDWHRESLASARSLFVDGRLVEALEETEDRRANALADSMLNVTVEAVLEMR